MLVGRGIHSNTGVVHGRTALRDSAVQSLLFHVRHPTMSASIVASSHSQYSPDLARRMTIHLVHAKPHSVALFEPKSDILKLPFGRGCRWDKILISIFNRPQPSPTVLPPSSLRLRLQASWSCSPDDDTSCQHENITCLSSRDLHSR